MLGNATVMMPGRHVGNLPTEGEWLDIGQAVHQVFQGKVTIFAASHHSLSDL